jgi:hypothetical protein
VKNIFSSNNFAARCRWLYKQSHCSPRGGTCFYVRLAKFKLMAKFNKNFHDFAFPCCSPLFSFYFSPRNLISETSKAEKDFSRSPKDTKLIQSINLTRACNSIRLIICRFFLLQLVFDQLFFLFLSASFAHQETVKSPKIKHKKIVPEAETRSVRDNTSNTCERALWVLRQRKRNGYLDITLKQAHREGRKKIESETLFGESERVSSSSRVDLFALGGEGFSSIPRRALIMKFSAKFNLEDREKALAGRTNIKRLTLLLDEACLLLNSLEKKSLAQEKYEAERFLKGKPLCGRPAKSRGTVSCEISACSACLGAESATERRFVNYKSCLWPRREKRFCE